MRFIIIFFVLLMASSVLADQGRVITPLADVSIIDSATLIRALNLNRVALSCTNTHSTIHVRWGNSSVSTSSGQQLRATQSIEITTTDAVYMAAESGSVTVSCTEETVR